MTQDPGLGRKEKAGDVFVIAIWFGIVSGLMEAALLSIFWFNPEWMTWQLKFRNASAEIFWVAPAFDMLLYSGLASVLLVLLKVKQRFSSRCRLLNHLHVTRLAFLLFTWIGLYSALTMPDRLNKKAALILAFGAALQMARWLRPRHDALMFWLRPRTPFSVALVVLLTLLIKGEMGLTEQLALARLPPAKPDLPNVLLVVVDTLRADHLSCYGYERATSPTIDRIASEGVLFENAFASSSWSPPSHASLFLGRRVSEHKVDGRDPMLGSEYPSLAEVMASSGYLTGGFSANLFWVTRRTGFARGFVHYEDYFTTVGDMIVRTNLGVEIVRYWAKATGYRDMLGRQSARDINSNFLSWLDSHRKRPFFVFLNYLDVHGPYISPAPFHTRFMTPEQRVEARSYSFNSATERSPKPKLAEAAYDGSIAYLDAQLDDLIRELDARDLLDNTILIITSDHGESFGENNQFGHGHSLSLEQIRIPLVIRYPRNIPAGVRVAAPVGFRAVPATVVDLTVGRRLQAVFPSPSLRKYWSDSVPGIEPRYVVSELEGRPWVPPSEPVSRGSQTSVILSGWQILFQNQQTQIFGLKTGPWKELTNTDAGRKVLREQVPLVKAWIQRNLSH